MFRNYTKYEVFDDGRVYSYKSKRFLKLDKNVKRGGYYYLSLSDNDGKIKKYQVHRVVYEAIRGEIPENYDINHLDEDPSNNAIWNLSACSHLDNIRYGSGIARSAEKRTNDPKRSKQVGAYKDDVLVMTFPSTAEAQRARFNRGNISQCCNGKLPHYKGYTWKYLN